MRGLKERGKMANLRAAFWQPKPWVFAAAGAEGMNEVVSGWCVGRY